MKKLLFTNLVLIICLSLNIQTVQAQKFAYVNSAVILADLPAVKQADAELEALQKRLQRQGQEKVEELQADYLVLQQKIENGELSPAQHDTEGKRLQDRESEIAEFEKNMINQIQEKRTQLFQPIYENINNAIRAVSKEEGYEMIFDQGILLFAEDYLDVTALVKTKLGL